MTRMATRFLGMIAVALSVLVSGNATMADDIPVTVYFFNPEINVDRNTVLKQKFDQLLLKGGHYRFQPVRDRAVFENLVNREVDRHAVYMLSDWHFRLLSESAPLTAYLIGEKNGSTSYRKLLVRRKQPASISSFKLTTVASAGSLAYSERLLKEILTQRPELSAATARLLEVPKDLDALLALGFGMADAAICTEDSLQQLAALYQNQYEQLAIWGESQTQQRMIVAARTHASVQQQAVLDYLMEFNHSAEGQIRLKMLGLDRWQRYSVIGTYRNEHHNQTGKRAGGGHE